ncbi:MAG: carbamoyltransferase HypF, partial [Eggerthellaceae bacterium]|nr:carbamoyltransferase HypF [Eggerthellaceae bacterium]
MIEALDIQIKGIVQGVGFRPFVYRQAKKHLVNGWVLNAADGVFVHAEAESKLLDEFVLALANEAPAAARVEELDLKEVPLQDCASFEIRFSDDAAVEKTTLVSPDLATCEDCVRELFDPEDRRYRYPFINCTNCGPRFTIIDRLPYDRAATSMAEFAMCPECAGEYEDPLDRRFHAQPDACFECGPSVSFAYASAEVAREAAVKMSLGEGDTAGPSVFWARNREESDAAIAAAVNVLRGGGILAVKGLGGFHLACDANDAEAVALLRGRKRREGKPFAVMMRTVEEVRAVCEVNEAEEQLLAGSQRPIVLLKKRADATFAPGLADDLSELGVMLPYTPLQHLLLHDFASACAVACASETEGAVCEAGHNPPMLVMTSGNLHDEPIVTDDAEAYEKLAGIADAFLGNNRAIRSRYDDSVVRVVRAGSAGFATQVIRRARGLAPVPIKVPLACRPTLRTICETSGIGETDAAASLDPVLFAAGPEQKNTFCLVRGDEAFVSQHIGDLENAETYDAWLEAKQRYETLFEARPTRLACDMHPEYLSTKWAVSVPSACRPTEPEMQALTQVQHHHAHIASVIGEHALEGAVCGIAFDGTGYGADGAIWGGEVLLANAQAFERFANFAYVPIPGGAAAVKNPLRMAYGVL